MVDLCGKDFSLLKQGAEAKLHVGRFLGKRAIVKERFTKRYRHPKLDEQLTRDRMKAEVRALIRCKTIGIRTPTIYLADVESSVLVMEYLEDAVTARDYIKSLVGGEDGGENKLVELADKIGRTLGKLHKSNVIHGDLTTSNILVEGVGKGEGEVSLVLIDFGLGFAEGSAEDKGVDLYVLERAFLSTHPNTERLFEIILRAYRKQLGGGKAAQEVMGKFEEIRLRGRKRTMVG